MDFWMKIPFVAILFLAVPAFCGELRGVWVDRSSLASRETIHGTLQKVAAAHLNAVYVNLWSRGYPLWRSAVFAAETGIETDPGYSGRDVLQEVIEEARPLGVSVIPWMEYGFVAGYSGYFPGEGGKGPIFAAHPDWLARDSKGNDAFPIAGGGIYYWLIHVHPEAQEFLIRLMEEIVRNYDVPAIQFDRGRYPSLDCGYDETTRALYSSEHGGAAPPGNINDAEWLRWRADKLNDFELRLSRRLKEIDWKMLLTDAPVSYPYGYVNFAQDYPSRMRSGALDFVSPQLYRRTAADYDAELNRQLAVVPDSSRIVAGLDITNSSLDELEKMIDLGRQRGLGGFIIWYYASLESVGGLERLRSNSCREPAQVPWKPTLMRTPSTLRRK